MSIDRVYIRRVATVVRETLSLCTPITIEQLEDAILKLGGECIAVANEEIETEAEITTMKNEETDSLFTIRYAENKPEKRILFSVAHELGHLFLHLLDEEGIKQEEVLKRSTDVTKQELEANEFAAEILMPEEEFIVKCKEFSEDGKVNISQIADYFKVSVQAATVRGNILGLW